MKRSFKWARRGVVAAAAAAALALPGAAAASFSVQTPPVIAGAPYVGVTLKTTTGDWFAPADLMFGFSFQWYHCASDGITCTPIDDATGDAYTLSTADLGRRVTVQVRAEALNGSDGGSTFDSATQPVQEAPISPGPLSVTDIAEGIPPSQLAGSLVGPSSGVSISNVRYTGAPRAAGTFTDTDGADGIGFGSGIVLSTGHVATRTTDVQSGELCSKGVEGPNVCHESGDGTTIADGVHATTSGNDTPGDAQLSSLIGGVATHDAAVLEFDFVPQYPTIEFRYVFGSEEYSDYANSSYPDVFAFFVNGSNCALVPGTNEPVSVNTINDGNDTEGFLSGSDPRPHNASLFRDNVRPTPSIDTELDGLTTVLTCHAHVNPGVTNHMELAIADAFDAMFDSDVFIEAGSLVSGTHLETTLSSNEVTAGTPVTDHAVLTGEDVSGATGTVSYAVYSDSTCTDQVASGGTKSVSAGVVPDSEPVTLTTPGTYYWRAAYSGDTGDNAATSACGDEVETVTVPPRTVSVADESVTEGGSLTFTLSLDKPAVVPITVDYATSDGTASAPGDYAAAAGTATFAAGDSAATVTVPTVDDALDEYDETLTLAVSDPQNASIGTATATGTIVDNDPPPTVSIGNASVREGDRGTTPATFTVSLSAPSGKSVSVGWSTADGTATAGSDYTAASGTFDFAPGETTKTITVDVLGDTIAEGNETFTVALATGASGVGTIVDDDNRPPVCEAASATPNVLWPVDHTFVTVTLGGCSDPDSDPLTYSIVSVQQDEPTAGTADAQRMAGHPREVKLRAERLGTGDGRVYVITFTVSDGHHDPVEATVTVSVPHDQDKPAVDSGRRYDSFS